MHVLPSDRKLLALLNEAQPDRPWRSCAEKRRCVACETVFRGSEVVVRGSRPRASRLACPKCGSAPALWVRLGNPLIDEEVWNDWESAIELVNRAREGEADTDIAVAG